MQRLETVLLHQSKTILASEEREYFTTPYNAEQFCEFYPLTFF